MRGTEGADDRRAEPPADQPPAVLTWDLRRIDLPRNKDGPALQVRDDGAVAVTEPHGTGRPVAAKLSAADLQQLLRFVVREQGVFEINQERLPAAGRGAAVEAVLYVSVDGKSCELRYTELAGNAGRSAEAGRLYAIQQRVERLITWAYAGGDEGTAAALAAANAQLHQEIPDAPALLAGDLRSAIQRIDGSSQMVFERRGVAEDGNPFSFVTARVERDADAAPQEPRVVVRGNLTATDAGGPAVKQKRKGPFDITPIPVAEDKSVNWDYPIVYIRAPRDPANLPQFPNTHPPTVMPVGSSLAILYPDGRDEVLVPAEGNEAITNPFVSFDGEWVFFVKFHDAREKRSEPPAGSDIYKVHVLSKKVVQLTQQGFTPNEGAVAAAATLERASGKTPKEPPKFLNGRGVYNLGPCPVPGGRVAFTSDRNAFRAAPAGTNHPFAHQLFVMDDDGKNVGNIGHLNLGGVLHPVILADGRLIFTTNETQGLRGGYFFWGVWSIHPDGTNWNPVISAYDGDVFHFYSQISDGTLVLSNYYPGGLTRGFGTYHRMPPHAPPGEPGFGPANANDPRNRTGPTMGAMPFKPYGLDSLTLFATKDDVRPNTALGKVTHPSGAPDNHLLTVWATSAAPVDPNQPLDQYANSRPKEPFDSGIYLIKSGRPVNEPGQMVLIRNDPKYHELWPRALVPYQRIYGVPEPKRLASPANDGRLSPHLPEGVPFGLVGSSSLYKRESYPDGVAPPGKVTAAFPVSKSDSSNDAFRNLGGIYSTGRNWLRQGADAGVYENSDIHAIRIVITEPVTSTGAKNLYRGHATNFQDLRPESAPSERLRILGEFPVRKFGPDGVQPSDPDGNPDTSFAVKIPADVAWTFQTLDKRGMVLNMSQTWHQVRPGEVRSNCGGCHAHSQKPTDFNLTAAAAPEYVPWDLTGRKLPLLTTKAKDQTGKRWDTKDQTGVRFADGITNVEYNRDVRPILQRSCAACHTAKSDDPPAKLVLDDSDNLIRGLPAPYYRLAMDAKGEFGHKPMEKRWAEYAQATRYVRKLQSRRSLLIWKVFGERLDGWTNDDHPTETEPGNPDTLQFQGQPIENSSRNIHRADIDFTGTAMPPPEAVAEGKVAPLTDDDRMTLARWVDLGCPLDLDFDPKDPGARGRGWMLDDNRPTIALTTPRAGPNDGPMTRLLLGLHDYNSGIDTASLTVTADFPINGVAAGENLAPRFKEKGGGVRELVFDRPLSELPAGTISVSVKDRQGNVTRIERAFSVTGSGR